MKKYFVLLFVILGMILTSQSASAQQRKIGIGAILGNPTGVSVKGWIDQNIAIDGAISFAVGDYSNFYVHSDILAQRDMHEVDENVDSGLFHFYYGGGLKIFWQDATSDVQVGVRVPGGINYTPSQAPAEIFMELVPTFDVSPTFEFSFGGAVGFRYFI